MLVGLVNDPARTGALTGPSCCPRQPGARIGEGGPSRPSVAGVSSRTCPVGRSRRSGRGRRGREERDHQQAEQEQDRVPPVRTLTSTHFRPGPPGPATGLPADVPIYAMPNAPRFGRGRSAAAGRSRGHADPQGAVTSSACASARSRRRSSPAFSPDPQVCRISSGFAHQVVVAPRHQWRHDRSRVCRTRSGGTGTGPGVLYAGAPARLGLRVRGSRVAEDVARGPGRSTIRSKRCTRRRKALARTSSDQRSPTTSRAAAAGQPSRCDLTRDLPPLRFRN